MKKSFQNNKKVGQTPNDKKKDCTGAQLSEVKKNISVIEKAVNEIKTDPELQKFAKRVVSCETFLFKSLAFLRPDKRR